MTFEQIRKPSKIISYILYTYPVGYSLKSNYQMSANEGM